MKKFIFICFFLALSAFCFAERAIIACWYPDNILSYTDYAEIEYAVTENEFKVRDLKEKKQTIYGYTIDSEYISLIQPKNGYKEGFPRAPDMRFGYILDGDFLTLNFFEESYRFVRGERLAKEKKRINRIAKDITYVAASVSAYLLYDYLRTPTNTTGYVQNNKTISDNSNIPNENHATSRNFQKSIQQNSPSIPNISSLVRNVGDNKQNYVYRVIRSDENPKLGLKAKNPERNMSIEGHIVSGTRNYGSQYISTTTDYSIAKEWAKRDNCKIVKIYLDKIPKNVKIYDLSTENGRNTFLKGITAKNFAKASKEVLIEGEIPSFAIDMIK